MQLIEISEIEKVIKNLEARANQRREDALTAPPLGPTYTGMAFVTDELVAELKALVRKHAKTFTSPEGTENSAVRDAMAHEGVPESMQAGVMALLIERSAS